MAPNEKIIYEIAYAIPEYEDEEGETKNCKWETVVATNFAKVFRYAQSRLNKDDNLLSILTIRKDGRAKVI